MERLEISESLLIVKFIFYFWVKFQIYSILKAENLVIKPFSISKTRG